MPLQLKKKLNNGIWADHSDAKISPLLRKPNSFQTRMQFFESWMNSKLSDGNTYVLKLRDEHGAVKQLRVLDYNKVTPYVTEDGEIFYQVRPDNVHGLEQQVMVPAREIIHDRFNCFSILCAGFPRYMLADLQQCRVTPSLLILLTILKMVENRGGSLPFGSS